MNMMNKCAKFHKDSLSGKKKLNSISRERLNFRRRPILCTTLYRNLTQASNFGGTFDQLFLGIFLQNFRRRGLSTSAIPWCKKVRNDQKLKSRGPNFLITWNISIKLGTLFITFLVTRFASAVLFFCPDTYWRSFQVEKTGYDPH